MVKNFKRCIMCNGIGVLKSKANEICWTCDGTGVTETKSPKFRSRTSKRIIAHKELRRETIKGMDIYDAVS